MFLKKKEINKFKFSKVFFKRLFYFISFLFLLISISIVTLFFFSGFWKHNKNEIISRFDNYGLLNIKHTGEILSHIIRSPFYSKDKIYIDIKFEDQIKLNEVRKQKLKNLDSFGISKINSENKVHVNARIKYNKSQKYNSKIRIKGDRKIHYEDQDKTSYSINIKGDNKISGMNEFSIIKPRARNYLNEWIFHQLLDEAKLPYIRYEFITVYINGTSKGLYALEEGYTEQLTERNNLRYGPIFSIDEDLSDMSETTLPDLYNRKFWNKTKERKYLSDYANSKLLDFFQGNLELEEVMDIEKWSTYLAIIDISQSYHGAREKSVKFYYNPLTTKFEPIGFDAHYVKIKDQRLLSEKFSEDQMELPTFLRHFFDNEDFYLNYLKKLEKYSSTDFLYNFFNKRNDEIKKISSLIYSDYFLNDYVFFFGPGIYYFNKERFFERSKYISNYLIFNKKKVSYFYLNEEYFIINNNSMKYLKLSSLKCNSNTEIKKISINHVLYKQNLNNITNLVTNHNCNQIMIKNINEKEFKFNLLNHSDYNRKNEIDKNAYKNIFDVNENEKIIKLKNKSAKITKNIYLPKSFKFQLKPGDKLEIKNNAFIFSESHWESLGNIDSPIIIYGKENNYGGGIYIYNNLENNIINNTYFKNLSGTNYINKDINNNLNYQKKFNLMGAVNFYNVNISLKNVYFNQIFSEDALNIVSSNNFKINNIYFNKINSDAVDIDFSTGQIENIYTKQINNDAIDFSKSYVILKNIFADEVGDKIISAGENSKIEIQNLFGTNSYIGVASKDGSNVFLKDFKFNDNKYNFASYIKKKGYKSPSINIYNDKKIEIVSDKILKDKNSKIYFKNTEYKINSKNSSILREIYN